MKNILKYPLELDETMVDYVIFESVKYRTNRSYINSDVGSFRNADETYRSDTREATGNTIILYMPNSTPGMANNNSWEAQTADGPLGLAQRNALTTATKIVSDIEISKGVGDDFMGNVDNVIKEVTSRYLGDEMKGATNLAKQVGINAIAGALNSKANAAWALTKGMIYNPNVELIYQGPVLRSFGFNYPLLPKSEKEAQQINKIIKTFKIRSAPEAKDGMFIVPDIWEVTYMTNGKKNKNMNQFKTCALSSINVVDNDSTEMHVSYDEGVPISTTLSLQFDEVDIITRQDHEASFSNRGY